MVESWQATDETRARIAAALARAARRRIYARDPRSQGSAWTAI